MADFLATYGIDDKALAIGLKRIEGLASAHESAMRKKEPFGEIGAKASKEVFGISNVAKAAFGGVGTAIGLAAKALTDYAQKNSMVASESDAIRRAVGGLWSDIGRDLAGINRGAAEQISVWRRLRDAVTDYLGAVGSSFIGPDGAQSISQIADQRLQRRAYESADVLLRARSKMNELESDRFAKGTTSTERLAAAEMRAMIEKERGLREVASLRAELESTGHKKEADNLERMVRRNADAVVAMERQRQSIEEMQGRSKTRKDLEDLKEKYATARESTADTIEANAARIFGLEASERQLQIAEVQLRYDQQLRDVARDKALLEEDRLRASALLNEQREAEMGILLAQRGERRNARSIALGSSVDARQAFAPIVNEERNDRKKAQEKFDRMVAELRKIRDNTATRQVATYQ